MCGICGVAWTVPTDGDHLSTVSAMVKSLRQRGPDESGNLITDRVLLGHARLSIIDIHGGRQPLYNEDETIAVVCNGEIYNHEELRRELIALGHQLRTKSDCEVIAHLWEEYGPEVVLRLRGMFAFVLYDKRSERLFGARDRFGQKPLYYNWDGTRFAFASEIKGLLTLPGITPELESTAMDQFLFHGFVPGSRTLFKGIVQLPAASTFELTRATLTVKRYWVPEFKCDYAEGDQTLISKLDVAIQNAVASHLVSDVPVGVFLSGGIDSSLVTAMACKQSQVPLQSFAISFPQSRQDEGPFAAIASRALGTIHREVAFSHTDLTERLERLAQTFDQPLADPAALPLAMLSEFASSHIKVVLTGDGGDELFGGYEKYCLAARFQLLQKFTSWCSRRLPKSLSIGGLIAARSDRFGLRRTWSRLSLRGFPAYCASYRKHGWEGWDRAKLYNDEMLDHLRRQTTDPFNSVAKEVELLDDPLNQMLLVDQLEYLPSDLLLKTDYCTMASGLEARAPLLDHLLAEVAGRLPPRIKASPTETKIALRRIAEKWLPPELIHRRKQGFSVPIGKWFSNELKGWVQEKLLHNSVTTRRYFNKETVAKVLSEHTSGHRNHANKVYTLLCFELWHRHYLPSVV